MKKNKIVKPLVIATAVAAVAGIAAVSFAEWKGDAIEKEVTGKTGIIVTDATITAESNNLSDTVKLVPYNQVHQYDADTMAKVWEIVLSTDKGSLNDYTYKISTESGLSLYAYTGTDEYVAPGAEGFDFTSGWTEITSAGIDVNLDDKNMIYVILDSDDVENDMNQSMTVKITATPTGSDETTN